MNKSINTMCKLGFISENIRGININTIISNFKEDINSLEYAREYGILEVIDGHLYNTYEGFFNDEEIEDIIKILTIQFNL